MDREILKLAIPNIIANITIPLLGMIDLALMGRLGNEDFIGAVALGTMIFNFIYWAFSFLRMGTSGFTAQAYGTGNMDEAITILSRSLFVGLLGAGFLMIFQVPIAMLSFSLIQGSAEVESLAWDYFSIRIWAAPATISLYSLTGWFIGMQNARSPMIISIAINIFNIVLNLLFVFGWNMLSNGVALGTVVAQYLGLVIAVWILFKKYFRLLPYWNFKKALNRAALRMFVMVNKDILIRTLCVLSVLTFFTAKSAATDNTILAVNSILLQFLLFFSFFVDGFAYAAEALTGKYIGAARPALLTQSTRRLFIWGAVVALLFSGTYLFGSDLILNLMTTDKEIIDLALEFIPWLVLLPLVALPAFIWDGIFIGATASVSMRNTMLAATVVFFLIFFLLRQQLNNHALWLGLILFMLTRGAGLTMLYKKHVFSRIG